MSPFLGSARGTESWHHFSFSVKGGVAKVVLDRPEVLNALTLEIYADLRDLLGELPQRDDVRVVVITGRGRGFCSGGDVDEIIGRLLAMDTRHVLEFTRMTGLVTQRMRALPQPIIAAVNGIAAGAGAVMALAADFRVLSTSASFAFLFTRVGLAGGDMGSAYLLPRLVGLGPATELLMLGDRVPAERALTLGLANAVVADERLEAEAEALARRLSSGPTLAYSCTKQLLTRELDMDLASAIDMEAATQALLLRSRDHREFHAATKEARDPRWKGT
jgi:enoyl-CoA hydratase/carnithine racemase